MTATVAELMTVQTAAEVEAELLDDLAAEGVEEAGYGNLTVARTLVTLAARAEARDQEIDATLTAVNFGDTAVEQPDEWVDLSVRGRYGITRLPATAARRLLTIANAVSGSAQDEPAGEVVIETGDGVQFDSLDRLQVAPGGSAPLLVRARVPGLGGNVPNGELLTASGAAFLPSRPGLSVVADVLVQAGRPAETNRAYIERGRAQLAPEGTAAAYQRQVAELYEEAGLENPVTAVRVDDANPYGPGSAAVFLAEATGAASPATVAFVGAGLQERWPDAAGALTVASASEVTIQVDGILTVRGNANAYADATQVLAAYQVEAQGAQTMLLAEVYQRLMSIAGVYNWVPATTADTPLSAFEVPVLVNALTVA